jgi:hypothetical protein
MATLPTITRDPTLDAVDAAIEARGNAEPERPYLGMSAIGRPCSRELWYGFRWCSKKDFDAATLKRFEDGHRTEDLVADRLRLAPGVTLYTIDPRTGGQFGHKDIAGHFRGHMDGCIQGLLQAPKRWHVWEGKATNEKKQSKLQKLKQEKGEKHALAEWDEVYYSQGVLYMHYSGMDRHYLTCDSPGGRTTVSVRTNANPAAAKALIEKARRIIQSPEPLAKISDRPDWYQCRWCDHHAVCHEGQIPQASCRTCAHATPEMQGDGRWSCARFDCDLPVDVQRQGDQCPAHVFIPALMPWPAVDADEAAGWIEYQKQDGTKFRNGPGGYASRELVANAAMAGDAVADEIRKQFQAEVTG